MRYGLVTRVQTCALPILLGGTLAFNGDGTTATDAGTYTVTPAGVTSDNYSIVFVDGSLVISKRSEERRVGKECRSRWSTESDNKKKNVNVTGGNTYN